MKKLGRIQLKKSKIIWNPGEIAYRLGLVQDSGEFTWTRDSTVHSGRSGTRKDRCLTQVLNSLITILMIKTLFNLE
jgi:hypothetical protein